MAALLVSAVCGGLSSCDSPRNYKKVDGEWLFVGRGMNRRLKADGASFKILSSNYAKDKLSVFYEGARIEAANAGSFTVLKGDDFAKDENSVFVHGIGIPEADSESIEIIKGPYARDKNYIFCGNVKMEVEDRSRFEVIHWEHVWSSDDENGLLEMFLGKQANEIKRTMEEPVVLGHAWARDGTHYYYGPMKVRHADYDSFVVVSSFLAKDKFQAFSGPISDQELEENKQDP